LLPRRARPEDSINCTIKSIGWIILSDSWNIVKQNRGCAGVDGMSISDVINYGLDEYLQELYELLLDTHRYHPRKIKRVYIPKANGEQRPLGIPVIRDRIVQTVTKILLEPIFEADFLDCSYGFRPNRSAHDALEEIRVVTNGGYKFVLDADISGYFDNINHEKLLEFVHMRVSDRKILKLIRKWLKCGIVGEEEIKENQKGTPQGGVISPLLANIYLHEFDKFWMQQTQVKGKLVRYCDDFVIMFPSKEDAELGLELVKAKMSELNLELNTEKTKIVDMRSGKEGFDFLGFHHRQVMSHGYKRRYTLKWPKKVAVSKIKQEIRQNLDSEKGKELRSRRGNEVESVFGDEKLNKSKRRYHLRGLGKIDIEAGLYYMSHNVRKIHKIYQEKTQKIVAVKKKMKTGLAEVLNRYFAGVICMAVKF